jgi:hypothetical protein
MIVLTARFNNIIQSQGRQIEIAAGVEQFVDLLAAFQPFIPG